MPHNHVSIDCPHRTNSNGTIDSICPRCYATIATSNSEAELARFEAGHICEPSQLYFFDHLKRKPVASIPRASIPRYKVREWIFAR